MRVSVNVRLFDRDADLQDMVLIALLGDSAPNLEAGGKSSMNVAADDHATFEQLELEDTELLKPLHSELVPCSTTMRQTVKKYGCDVRRYVDAKESTIEYHECKDHSQRVVIQQAIPKVLLGSGLSSGSAVMLVLGPDIGKLQDNRATPFFEGSSRASKAVLNCFAHFALWEQDPGKGLEGDANLKAITKLAGFGFSPLQIFCCGLSRRQRIVALPEDSAVVTLVKPSPSSSSPSESLQVISPCPHAFRLLTYRSKHSPCLLPQPASVKLLLTAAIAPPIR